MKKKASFKVLQLNIRIPKTLIPYWIWRSRHNKMSKYFKFWNIRQTWTPHLQQRWQNNKLGSTLSPVICNSLLINLTSQMASMQNIFKIKKKRKNNLLSSELQVSVQLCSTLLLKKMKSRMQIFLSILLFTRIIISLLHRCW